MTGHYESHSERNLSNLHVVDIPEAILIWNCFHNKPTFEYIFLLSPKAIPCALYLPATFTFPLSNNVELSIEYVAIRSLKKRFKVIQGTLKVSASSIYLIIQINIFLHKAIKLFIRHTTVEYSREQIRRYNPLRFVQRIRIKLIIYKAMHHSRDIDFLHFIGKQFFNGKTIQLPGSDIWTACIQVNAAVQTNTLKVPPIFFPFQNPSNRPPA